MNQELINMIAGVAFSVFGWFARILWVAVREMEKDLSKLREELPRIYLPKFTILESVASAAGNELLPGPAWMRSLVIGVILACAFVARLLAAKEDD
jgi:hypothetical protein